VSILQSRLSGLYFKDFGLWVNHVAEALRFGTAESARRFVACEHVHDVAVLETPEVDVLQPVPNAGNPAELE
jgi:hypothetical protein